MMHDDLGGLLAAHPIFSVCMMSFFNYSGALEMQSKYN